MACDEEGWESECREWGGKDGQERGRKVMTI